MKDRVFTICATFQHARRHRRVYDRETKKVNIFYHKDTEWWFYKRPLDGADVINIQSMSVIVYRRP